jgi:16S rRNA (uracil1498-N3)-methyltransferase
VHRFFTLQNNIVDGEIIRLGADDFSHIRALRLRPSELFIVCDGEGTDYVCRLGERGDDVAVVVESRRTLGEPDIACGIYLAYTKGDRLDFAVQKSVELGAREIVLFPSERCIAVPGDASKKAARFQRISLEAAKQCGRGRVPEVIISNSFEDAVSKASLANLPLFCYEDEKQRSLKSVLESYSGEFETVSIVTGPEGGFSPQEAKLAAERGMISVTLGARILRCETAPIAAIAALMYHCGD